MASARSRATRSVGPPAENGTTIVMGLSLAGKSAAWTPNAADTNMARGASDLSNEFMRTSLKVNPEMVRLTRAEGIAEITYGGAR